MSSLQKTPGGGGSPSPPPSRNRVKIEQSSSLISKDIQKVIYPSPRMVNILCPAYKWFRSFSIIYTVTIFNIQFSCG